MSLYDYIEEYRADQEQKLMGLLSLVGGQGAPQTSSTGLSAPSTGSVGPVSGDLRGWVNEAIDITGVRPQKWRPELLDLAMRESSGNPRAYNDNPVASGQHAQGLFQTIPSTFEAYNIDRLGGIYDPVANAVAAIRYIMDRYGGPGNLPSSGGY